MSVSWHDERYIARNEHWEASCKSREVIWTDSGQFWLPTFFVEEHVLELVIGELM